MAKCKYFKAVNPKFRENCANCQRWNVDRCRDEKLMHKSYEESKEFDFFDRMMRNNKGINWS